MSSFQFPTSTTVSQEPLAVELTASQSFAHTSQDKLSKHPESTLSTMLAKISSTTLSKSLVKPPLNFNYSASP